MNKYFVRYDDILEFRNVFIRLIKIIREKRVI